MSRAAASTGPRDARTIPPNWWPRRVPPPCLPNRPAPGNGGFDCASTPLFTGGVTGSGKSSLGKLLVERDLLLNWQRGDHSVVIDPDLEYQQLAQALGGTVVRLAPGSGQRLNPFDLLPPRCDLNVYLREASKGDRLAEKIADLHAMLDILLAEDVSPTSSGLRMLTKREKRLLDRGLYETYHRAGITADPPPHPCHPPLLPPLYAILKSRLSAPHPTHPSRHLYP